MKRLLPLLLAAPLLLNAACSSTSPETEETAAARVATTDERPPGSSEVLGAYVPGTATETPETTADALRGFNDAEFLLTAASSNQLEMQLSQLAAVEASSAAVKQYAQQLAEQHQANERQLLELAGQLSVRPSAAIMPMHQELLDRMKDKTGEAFDRRFLDVMKTAHKLDVVMFEAKSKKAESSAVQAFAAQQLPALQAHLAEARELEKAEK